jgi:L-amino acid N-acyltransferase
MLIDRSFVTCTYDRHGAAILAIFNEAILRSTALYDYEPRTTQQLQQWFEAKNAARWPVLGLVDPTDRLLGFATYGTFRAWSAYKYTVEHSVYVHQNYRGQGIGFTLLARLIEFAEAQQLHTMVGAIDAQNAASRALHSKLGFHYTGTLRQVGYKFGQWLDVAFYQRLLSTPTAPNEQ